MGEIGRGQGPARLVFNALYFIYFALNHFREERKGRLRQLSGLAQVSAAREQVGELALPPALPLLFGVRSFQGKNASRLQHGTC